MPFKFSGTERPYAPLLESYNKILFYFLNNSRFRILIILKILIFYIFFKHLNIIL